jgi:hypothetical protein
MKIIRKLAQNSYHFFVCILFICFAPISGAFSSDELCKMAHVTEEIKNKIILKDYIAGKLPIQKEEYKNYYNCTILPKLKKESIIKSDDEHLLRSPSDSYLELLFLSGHHSDGPIVDKKSPEELCSDISYCEQVLSIEHELRNIIKTGCTDNIDRTDKVDINDPEQFFTMLRNNINNKTPLGEKLRQPTGDYWKLLKDGCPGLDEDEKKLVHKNTYVTYQKIHDTYRKFLTHPRTFSRLSKDRRVIASSSLIIGLVLGVTLTKMQDKIRENKMGRKRA